MPEKNKALDMLHEANWEKIGIYLAVSAAFLTAIIYLSDIKERVAKLEVKVEHLEQSTSGK